MADGFTESPSKDTFFVEVLLVSLFTGIFFNDHLLFLLYEKSSLRLNKVSKSIMTKECFLNHNWKMQWLTSEPLMTVISVTGD